MLTKDNTKKMPAFVHLLLTYLISQEINNAINTGRIQTNIRQSRKKYASSP